jgi:hypothetical protein
VGVVCWMKVVRQRALTQSETPSLRLHRVQLTRPTPTLVRAGGRRAVQALFHKLYHVSSGSLHLAQVLLPTVSVRPTSLALSDDNIERGR